MRGQRISRLASSLVLGPEFGPVRLPETATNWNRTMRTMIGTDDGPTLFRWLAEERTGIAGSHPFA